MNKPTIGELVIFTCILMMWVCGNNPELALLFALLATASFISYKLLHNKKRPARAGTRTRQTKGLNINTVYTTNCEVSR